MLQDEKYVVRWLSQYGTLAKAQVFRLLKDKTPQTAEKIIRNLKREVMIVESADGYYLSLDNFCEIEPKTIAAMWVMLSFADQISPMEHYLGSYPSQIYFLKNNIEYEILVLNGGEGYLTRLLHPKEDMKYIIVVPDLAVAKDLKLPEVPCLIATLKYNGDKEPEVQFYTAGGEK